MSELLNCPFCGAAQMLNSEQTAREFVARWVEAPDDDFDMTTELTKLLQAHADYWALPLAHKAKLAGLSQQVVSARLKRGWTVADALASPAGRQGPKSTTLWTRRPSSPPS